MPADMDRLLGALQEAKEEHARQLGKLFSEVDETKKCSRRAADGVARLEKHGCQIGIDLIGRLQTADLQRAKNKDRIEILENADSNEPSRRSMFVLTGGSGGLGALVGLIIQKLAEHFGSK